MSTMPCEPLLDKNGKPCGFICSRGRTKPAQLFCYKCGKLSTKLCDYRDGFSTCDKPMCDECAHHIGKDTDYCDEHCNEFSQVRTDKENRRLGLETEDTP